MEKGQKYKLISFNGTKSSKEQCDPQENYWKLIGLEVTIEGSAEELNFHDANRVLVFFSTDLISEGLVSHNSIPNTLWIHRKDLERVV